MQGGTSRPTSVTGLAVLAIILGVLSILTGIAGVGLGALVVGDYSSLAATILLTLGTIVFVFGILEIVYGVGFLQGNGWSWTLAMVVAMVSRLQHWADRTNNDCCSKTNSDYRPR